MGAWGRTCSRLKSRMRRLRAGVDIFLELKGVSRGWRGGELCASQPRPRACQLLRYRKSRACVGGSVAVAHKAGQASLHVEEGEEGASAAPATQARLACQRVAGADMA